MKIRWSCYKPQNVEELIEQHSLHVGLEASVQSEELTAAPESLLIEFHQ